MIIEGPISNNLFAIEKKDGAVISQEDLDNLTEEELSKYITSDGAFIIEPGASIYFLARLGVKSAVGSADGGKMMMRGSYSTKLTFTQPATN